MADKKVKLSKIFKSPETKNLLELMEPHLKDPFWVKDDKNSFIYGEESDLTPEVEGFPIYVDSEVIGVIFGTHRARILANHLQLLARIGKEMKMLMAETLSAYREVNLFYKLSKELTTDLSLKKVSAVMAEEAIRLFKANGVAIFMQKKEEGKEDLLYNTKTISMKELDRFRSLVNKTISRGTVQVINRFSVSHDKMLRSLIVAPMSLDGEVFGVFIVGLENVRDFTARDLKLAEALASQTATSISITLMHEREVKKEREYVALMQEYTDSQLRLEEAYRLATIGEMAASIAHEINSPLGLIIGECIDLIDSANSDEISPREITNTGKRIESTAMRIAKIARGLMNLARKEQVEEIMPVKVQNIIEDVLALCHKKIVVNELEVTVEPIPDNLEIECNPVGISQVILNLIHNAMDAVRELEERWITISVSDKEDNILIMIKDSGSGVPLHQQEKIFTSFFTTKEVGKGTGLGLSISRRIINSHQGQLSIDNQCANTCFLITLPKKSSREPSKEDEIVYY